MLCKIQPNRAIAPSPQGPHPGRQIAPGAEAGNRVKLEERTIGGLHDFLISTVFSGCRASRRRLVDLGAGSGALAVRLRELGFEVLAVDQNPETFRADVPFTRLDLDEPDFASRLGEGLFDLVTAVEVIEHVESPIAFLRNVRRLLKPGAFAVLTTPNVDCAPARLKFLLTGKLRMMDERGDPTHISPVFWDLLLRQYLPRSGLKLTQHWVYPPHGYKGTRRRYAWAFHLMDQLLAQLLAGEALLGDIHVLLLRSQTLDPG